MSRFGAVCCLLFATLFTAAGARAQAPASMQGEYPGLETGKMWTFDAPPLAYWATRYDFHPDQAWLDHARLAAGRLSSGCSASFVSPEGLILTNHHCARACVEAVTKPGEDLLANGFSAAGREEERPCPGLVMDQLQSITDVTDSVNAGVSSTTPSNQAAELRRAAIGRIERACGAGADTVCQVVTMYRGGQYKLYRFRRFSDVRLVFAVESQTAFFGGDPDNFTYPRHDLDVSILRAYEDNAPAHTEYFKWSPAGTREGDLVFVVGNPGSTGRLNTMAQLTFLRDVQYPAQLDQLARMIRVYKKLSNQSEDRAKALRNTLFGLENAQKAIGGYQTGLLDPALMARKEAWEKNFQQKVAADPKLKQQFGDPWQGISAIRDQMHKLDAQRRFYSFGTWGARLLPMAGLLVRMPEEMAKPDSQRQPSFRERNRARVLAYLGDQTTVDTALEAAMLAQYLTAMKAALPASDPVVQAALGGRTPDAAARAMVASTSLTSAEGRKALMDGGTSALQASNDPFIKLARVIAPLEEKVQARSRDLSNDEAKYDERIARALLAVFGNSVAPDATFSLRISDGEVKRYPMNGTYAPAYTTFYGLYDRHYAFGGEAPWDLTQRWLDYRDSLDLSTPLDLVATADIIGGNSGSPVIDRKGRLVGLIFDGNIEMLPNRFLFTERVARAVAVDSRGIVEALRKVYGATALADELTGTH